MRFIGVFKFIASIAAREVTGKERIVRLGVVQNFPRRVSENRNLMSD